MSLPPHFGTLETEVQGSLRILLKAHNALQVWEGLSSGDIWGKESWDALSPNLFLVFSSTRGAGVDLQIDGVEVSQRWLAE